jgi:NADPH:quinone reductase-like Zn-dependent oxidoreductase
VFVGSIGWSRGFRYPIAVESQETTIKAIVRSEYGPPDVLDFEDVATPVPEDDEVLVHVRASSVNMADVDYLLGRPKFARLGTGLRVPRNRGLGLDVAGVVEAVGENAKRFRPGDEVFGDLTEHGFGAFAEYACASEGAFAAKPNGLTFEAAAAVPQAGVLALQGIRSKRPIQPGQHVLINGAGGNIGPFAVQIAKSLGAEVTGVDSADKLDMLCSIGADHVIDYAEVDYTKTGQQYDRILDVAAYRPIRESRRALRPKGVYVAVPGSIAGVFQAVVVGPLMSMVDSRTMGMHIWKPFDQNDVSYLTQLLESGDVVPVIDRSYPLNAVREALVYQDEGRARGKLVIAMG